MWHESMTRPKSEVARSGAPPDLRAPRSARMAPQAEFPEKAMSRATASERVDGNDLVLQFEGPHTFDAWIDAISQAREFVHFENYILRNDRVGWAFRDALVERARAGVQVRVLYDWMGCWATPSRYWRPFREAGVEVRAFNPPSVRDPFGLFQRDHRKLVCVDGDVAFLGGFCIGEEWAGKGGAAPWRDTGVEVRGPGAGHLARTFERIWAELGDPVPREVRIDLSKERRTGGLPVWVIEGLPWRSRVYRATQLMAAVCRDRFWITDPYFVAPRPVQEALAAAARDGVDVRILVPGHNNWPWVGSLSRGGYRFLLEAGVRIFEWQGPMIHAKTSVADGLWSRIGSSNLNVASLLGNWELDVGILDAEFASQMEGLFLADQASSVEVVLPGAAPPARTNRVPAHEPAGVTSLEPAGVLHGGLEQILRSETKGRTLTVADLVRAGSQFGDAIAGHRTLGREDRAVLSAVAGLVLAVAVLAAVFPRFVGWATAVLFGWFGLVLSVRLAAQRIRKGWDGDGTGDGAPDS